MKEKKSNQKSQSQSNKKSQARKNMQTLETIAKPSRRNSKMEASCELKSSKQEKRKSK